MHYMYLFSLKRLGGSLKARVEQIWLEICDQGPQVPRRRSPLGGCFIDLPSYRPLPAADVKASSGNQGNPDLAI